MAIVYFNNTNKAVHCAADTFMFGLTELDYDPATYTFTGISDNKKFTLIGVDSFKLGRKSHHYRTGVPKVDLYFSGKDSSIALESIFAFLMEAYLTGKVRDTYKGLVGNCKGNEVAQGKLFNPNWVEIVTKVDNDIHREIWHPCLDAGVRVVFSAKDIGFIAYIKNIQVLLDSHIKQYPGIQRVVYAGTEYWEVK